MAFNLNRVVISDDAVAKKEKLNYRKADVQELTGIIDQIAEFEGLETLAQNLRQLLTNEEDRVRRVAATNHIAQIPHPLATPAPLKGSSLADIGLRHITEDFTVSQIAGKLTKLMALVVAIQTYRGSTDYILPFVVTTILAWFLSVSRNPSFSILREIQDVNSEIHSILEPVLSPGINSTRDAYKALDDLETFLVQYTISAEQQIIQQLLINKGLLKSLARLKTNEGKQQLINGEPFQQLKQELEAKIQELDIQRQAISTVIEQIKGKLESVQADSISLSHQDPLADSFEPKAAAAIRAEPKILEEIEQLLQSLMPTLAIEGDTNKLDQLKDAQDTKTKTEVAQRALAHES